MHQPQQICKAVYCWEEGCDTSSRLWLHNPLSLSRALLASYIRIEQGAQVKCETTSASLLDNNDSTYEHNGRPDTTSEPHDRTICPITLGPTEVVLTISLQSTDRNASNKKANKNLASNDTTQGITWQYKCLTKGRWANSNVSNIQHSQGTMNTWDGKQNKSNFGSIPVFAVVIYVMALVWMPRGTCRSRNSY